MKIMRWFEKTFLKKQKKIKNFSNCMQNAPVQILQEKEKEKEIEILPEYCQLPVEIKKEAPPNLIKIDNEVQQNLTNIQQKTYSWEYANKIYNKKENTEELIKHTRLKNSPFSILHIISQYQKKYSLAIILGTGDSLNKYSESLYLNNPNVFTIGINRVIQKFQNCHLYFVDTLYTLESIQENILPHMKLCMPIFSMDCFIFDSPLYQKYKHQIYLFMWSHLNFSLLTEKKLSPVNFPQLFIGKGNCNCAIHLCSKLGINLINFYGVNCRDINSRQNRKYALSHKYNKIILNTLGISYVVF